LDVFKEPHFSTLISRLFDVYKRYPNQKTWTIIKKALHDYINVISFIKESILSNSQWDYDTLLQIIWEKFWEKIKILSDTDELKQYFTVYRSSTLLFSEWEHDAKKILQLLGADIFDLKGNIDVSLEEWLLCFTLNDTDFAILYDIKVWEQIPNWCLWKKRFKYKEKYLPIILLRKDNPEVEWTKSHEIQHHINNTLFRKDTQIDLNNLESFVNDRFKDEIIAQAIHWSKVIHSDGTTYDEGISFYTSNIYNPNSYDFPFQTLHTLVWNHYRKIHDKELDENLITTYIQQDSTLKNRYFRLRESVYRDDFDVADSSYLARNMIKHIPNANLILTLTPFDNREQLKEIYKDDMVSE
jgi:hypothetical protein